MYHTFQDGAIHRKIYFICFENGPREPHALGVAGIYAIRAAVKPRPAARPVGFADLTQGGIRKRAYDPSPQGEGAERSEAEGVVFASVRATTKTHSTPSEKYDPTPRFDPPLRGGSFPILGRVEPHVLYGRLHRSPQGGRVHECCEACPGRRDGRNATPQRARRSCSHATGINL
jgi:hypothetical protein